VNDSQKIAAINLARDLCLKLLERRALAPDQLAGAMSLITVAAENLIQETKDGDGLWLVRLARDFTLKYIERGLIGSAQAAAVGLAETGDMVTAVAARLSPNLGAPALNAARDLTLKMLETGRLSRAAAPALFEELALAVGQADLK